MIHKKTGAEALQERLQAQLGPHAKVDVKRVDKKAAKGKRVDLLDNKVAHKLGIGVSGSERDAIGSKMRKLWQDALDSDLWNDGDFMDDVRQATLRGAHPAAQLLFYLFFGFIVLFLVWATFAPLDEVTHGQGQVIPSGKVQEVGSSEGGVVKAIMVREGDIVEPGQPLVRVDDSSAAAGVGEKVQRRDYLKANMLRIQAELADKPLVFPAEMQERLPQLVSATAQQYQSNMAELASTNKVYSEQLQQRTEELRDARQKAANLKEALRLAQKEYNMTKPYLDSGSISKVDVLRLQRQVVDAQKDYDTAATSIPAAEAALREAQGKLSEAVLKFKNDERDELGKLTDEFNRLGQGIKADESRVDQALLRSPIRAEVKQVLVNTVGQVVQPNTNIVELVPMDETLLIEAKIKPNDIAFIRPGLKAKVRITAYDYSIYGGLDGTVENVSADSFTEDHPGIPGEPHTYFKVLIRTQKNYLEHDGQKLPIRSGMVASADIVTGQKTVMQYLLKPINKARELAMTER